MTHDPLTLIRDHIPTSTELHDADRVLVPTSKAETWRGTTSPSPWLKDIVQIGPDGHVTVITKLLGAERLAWQGTMPAQAIEELRTVLRQNGYVRLSGRGKPALWQIERRGRKHWTKILECSEAEARKALADMPAKDRAKCRLLAPDGTVAEVGQGDLFGCQP